MFGSTGPSLADIAAVTDNNRNNGGFADGNGWWVLILLFAIFGGWGGGYGYGNNGGAYQAAVTNADLQRGFDTQSILGSLRGIEQGLCSLGYDQLSMFNSIGTTVMQTGNQVTNAVRDASVESSNNFSALSRQLSDCCCENRAGQKDILFEMSKADCATNNNIHMTGDAIIRSQQDGFNMLNQTINDRFTQMELAAKDTEIANLRTQLSDCNLETKFQNFATYLINTIRPTAIPSYDAPSPFAACGCGSNWRGRGCCDQQSCCGC